MEEILKKILLIIRDRIDYLNNEIVVLEKNNIKEKQEKISKFLKSNYYMDIDAIEEIYSFLNSQKVKSLDEYRKNARLYEEIKDIPDFSNIVDQIEVEFKELRNAINSEYTHLLNSYSKIIYAYKQTKQEKDELELLMQLFINMPNVINEDMFNKIVDFVKECKDLTDEEKIKIVSYLTIRNANNLSLLIKKESGKIIVKAKRAQKQTAKINEKELSVEPVEQVETNSYSEEQIKLIESIKNVLNEYSSFKEDVKGIVLSFGKDFEQRKQIYSTFSKFEDKKQCVACDLYFNFLLKLNENSFDVEMFDLISKIYDYYCLILDEEKQEDKKRNIDYQDILKNNNMIEQLELLNGIDIFISELYNKITFENSYIYKYIEEILQIKDEYIETIKTYYLTNDSEFLNISKLYLNDIIEKYNNLCLVCKGVIQEESKKEEPKEFANNLLIGDEFYKEGNGKSNFIMFFGDHYEIESDIDDNLQFPNKPQIYKSVYKVLENFSVTDFSPKSDFGDDHKVKDESYLNVCKKYNIRSHKKGIIRIIYSKIHTNIPEAFPEFGNFNSIVFVSGIGYGATDSLSKSKLFYESLRRIKDNEEFMEIVSLFQTDWKSLTQAEKNEKREQVLKYINSNKIKLGHFISKSASLENKKEKVSS